MAELKIEDVFSRIEYLTEKSALPPRDANVLRLLGEEMFSMTMILAESIDCTFSISNSKKQFELRLCGKAKISPKNKQDFVSVSSRKENVWAKGLIGKICSAMENSIYDNGNSSDLMFHPNPVEGNEKSQVWSLNEYMQNTSPEKQKEDWDGLERSILINTADDIIISIGGGQIEMTVKKTFKEKPQFSMKA